jgi:putative transposase
MPQTGKAVGIDFGLKTFLSTSEGKEIISPEPLKAELATLAKLNRSLAKKTKGSNRWKKCKRRLAKKHRRISNVRRAFHLDNARKLLERYDKIAIEDLNLNGMKMLWGRKVSDLGYASFVSTLQHLAEREGKEVTKVDRYFASSKTCYDCGEVNQELTLNDRVWACKNCGGVHQRDINAAKNILERAFSSTVGDVRRE